MPSVAGSSWPPGLEWLGGFVRRLEDMCYRLSAGSITIRIDSDSRGNIRILFTARKPIAPLYFDMSYNREEQYWAPHIEGELRNAISNYYSSQATKRYAQGYRPRLIAFDALDDTIMRQATINIRFAIDQIRAREYRRLEDEVVSLWSEPTKEDKNRHEANTKAEKFLLEKLSPTQRLDWKTNNFFLVKGNITGISYKLKLGRIYNIEAFLFGKRIGMFCITSKNDNIPIYDLLLAQKLLIETDEQAFINMANLGE